MRLAIRIGTQKSRNDVKLRGRTPGGVAYFRILQ
jgi:hypothetical protein